MKNKPDIRFDGFNEDWEQCKLIDIVNRVNKSSNSNVLPKVEFEDIVSGEGRLNKDVFLKLDDRKGILFEPENILYGKLRPYLKNWLFPNFSGVALGDFWVFKATNISVPSFDFYLIQSDNYQKVANDTSGTKMPRSDWKKISATDFAIPGKQEQHQIGVFFQSLDNLITLHQRELENYKLLKKGFLQKLFPSNGDTNPSIRFDGFTDAWEQRKLGDEFEKVNERNDGTFGKDKWISVAKMYFQEPEKVQSNNIDTRTYVMREGDIAFEGHPNANFKFGRFVANDIGAGVVSELFPIYRHKVEYDNNYWKHAIQLESIMQPIYAKSITSSGNSSNKLDPKHFLRQAVYVPRIDEQYEIGGFFRNLDNLITLHQRELDNYKELKKGFLQKMFV
ncbi:restriction endonuclease subunit S [Erysipelothrix amsterdamensis]|uniref:Restriction endonuclease subunit S n=1 Tax=Erysipelothrix amsterdamensis TaxID=2929157 RepID=A0AAU9VJT1_9FIRM|nr:restriction endonuclease subunit S [Erysipelothrix sp. A18Y020d]CAH2762106.1 restriction endonuclease subunit S [Erysipelothrix sp. A18Y020d]